MPNGLKNLVNRMRGHYRPPADDEAQWVHDVVRGDPSAFEQLVVRYADMAYGLAWRMTQQHELAEDIVQECFIKVWQQAGSWNPAQGQFSTWLYQIVYNRCLDELRSARHRYQQAMPDDWEPEAPQDNTAIYTEQQQQFQQALSQLKLEQRTAIALVYRSDLSNQAAATVMGLQLKAFESLLGRAKAQLKQRLDPHE